ncbi:hypothetical protein FZC77_20975 [Bacillus swezeyi]|uniref:Uncharacterized protein n=1 Tax=Bacillus swezeyi TaxID=1925020 RepID=A0A5M8RJ96_9BACI|nr:hypothetical protein DX927_21685 [Bacillus swezeyi]KAA6472865.1 hypothetical protein DX928_20970 [Bacillus swezeyi]TYS32711.1 hypothetical protein FZC77_20975 [Bacillus swezeyi]
MQWLTGTYPHAIQTVEKRLSTTVSFVKMLSIMIVDRKNEAKDIHIGYFRSGSRHFPLPKKSFKLKLRKNENRLSESIHLCYPIMVRKRNV